MAPNPSLAGLLDRRFIAVTGKGGTGKTTVASALALLAASRGKRVLVCMTQARERMSAMLETEFITQEVTSILNNIDAVNMEPESALEEYGMMVLRVRALYKAVMDNRVVKGFLRAVPGIDAWAMLGKALFHAKEEVDGRPRYDLVILDAPATGHGLQMLRVPKVICDVAPPGLLRREAEEGLAMLRDTRRCAVVVVSLPEEMPAAETEELTAALRTQLEMPPQMLVVNQTLPVLFEPKAEAARRMAAVLSQVEAFAPLGVTVHERLTREVVQKETLLRLAKLSIPTSYLPSLAVERLRRTHLQQFAKMLSDAGV